MSPLDPHTNQTSPRERQQDTIIPRYMGTFADLMTLLLCFFVLLVAMAEIDALKYKMVVRSMEDAFGVERPESKDEIVMGTSVIQQTFSPTPDKPTPLSQVRQSADPDHKTLKTSNAALYQLARLNSQRIELQTQLKTVISQGLISLETMEDRLLIRINEQASFPSGSAMLKSGFIPVLKQVAEVLSGLEGQFVVAGHTDNVPLNSRRYRSNWELAAARATSVVHALLDFSRMSPDRFRIESYADIQPLASNDTAEGRAVNRRVEIGIINSWQPAN
jgi:chemotaxis protein MotB